MSKRILLGIGLGLLLLLVASAALWIFVFIPNQTVKPVPVQLSSYASQRSQEVPLSLHRAQSMVAIQNTTTYMPWGIALDKAHGYVWVAEPGCNPTPRCSSTTSGTTGAIGQYAFSDGTFIQTINEPTGYTSPLFLLVDSGGRLWFSEPNSNAIGEFDPQSGNWNQWSVKKGATPYDMVFDTQGNIWFTEIGSNSIGFLNTQTHTLVETSTPTPNSNPYGITSDAHGTIWFTENQSGLGQIGSFTPTASGKVKITEHAVTAQRPHLITTDNAGNIWYSDGFTGRIGKFDPTSGTSSSYLVYSGICTPTNCTGTHISGIAIDAQGHIWFTDSLSQRVGYLIPASGQVVAKTLTTNNAHPYDGLVIDSSDRVWFTEQFSLMLTMWPATMLK